MFGFCVGKCHDFNQPLTQTHTHSLALGECVCAVQCCYCCRCCHRRRRCCCFSYQNRSFKCVFTCIVGRLLCLRLFDVLQAGEVNALAQSKSTVVKLKNQFAVKKEKRKQKFNEPKQNNTCNMSCYTMQSNDGLNSH